MEFMSMCLFCENDSYFPYIIPNYLPLVCVYSLDYTTLHLYVVIYCIDTN